MNNLSHWSKEVPIPVTVCDKNGIILEMNNKSLQMFEQDGGAELLGKNLLDCHPEPSKSKLIQMLASQKPNTYLVEGNGVQQLIHEMPWFIDGEYQGFVEISIDLPKNIKCSAAH